MQRSQATHRAQRGRGGCSSRPRPAGKGKGTICPVDENVLWLPFLTAESPGGGIAPWRETAAGCGQVLDWVEVIGYDSVIPNSAKLRLPTWGSYESPFSIIGKRIKVSSVSFIQEGEITNALQKAHACHPWAKHKTQDLNLMGHKV